MWRWRILVGFIVLASLGGVVALNLIEGEPAHSLSFVRQMWMNRQTAFSSDVHPPRMISMLSALLALEASAALLLYATPRPIGRISRALGSWREGGRALLLGLCGLVIVVVIGITASFTMLTFPLVILLGLMLFMGAFVGFTSLAYALGRSLLLRAGWGHLSPLISLLLGILILFSVSEIPWVGVAFKILVASLSLGAAIATRFGSGQPWNLDCLSEENLPC